MDLLNPVAGLPVGTDIAHAIRLTLVGGLAQVSLGNVDVGLLGAHRLGAIPGIILGLRLIVKVNRIDDRNAIAIPLTLVGGKLLLPA